MRHNARFVVFVRLELEQVVGALAFVKRSAAMQHQSFAAIFHGFGEQDLQRLRIRHLELRHGLNPGLVNPADHAIQGRNTFRERAALRGQVKHHETHGAPG